MRSPHRLELESVGHRYPQVWAAAVVVGLVASGLSMAPAEAASFYVAPDVPTDLGGTTYLPWEIVRNDSGAYSSLPLLPDGTPVDALHPMDEGDWLLSVEWPTDLGGTTYDPRDVVRFDGASYALFFDGDANGVPGSSNVDAAFLDGGDAGDLILSFDVPTTIGGSTYEPADLVRFSGGAFSLFFDASAASPAVPATSNVTGADQRGALTILTFDIPTTLGASTFLPGELVSWDGTSFASFYSDPSWLLSSIANGLAFLGNPGSVPVTITVDKSALTPGDLTISWAPSCSSGAEDYGIYEGQVGSWYSHTQIDCSDDGGDFTEEITPSAGNRYYLVVPRNPNDEGSYGTDSLGMERPAGSSVCITSQALAPCP